jgi:hypothetical protein
MAKHAQHLRKGREAKERRQTKAKKLVGLLTIAKAAVAKEQEAKRDNQR